MIEWETSLSIRDGVFAQMFILTCLVVIAYRLLLAPRPIWRKVSLSAGVVLFLALFALSLANIWEPLL